MRKEFKVGEYYIFYGAKKKVGKAKIHALIQIDGVLHAVFTYYIDDVINSVRTLPVEIEENADAIHFCATGCYLTAASPVLPKPIKFKVREVYIDDKHNFFEVTDKYTDRDTTYIVLDNKYVTSVGEIGVDDDVVEYVDFLNVKLFANKTLKEIEK